MRDPQAWALYGLSYASMFGLVACGLVSCTTVPSAPITKTVPESGELRFKNLRSVHHFFIEAKLAVQYSGKGYTARIEWQHDNISDHLRIYNPLGQQITTIDRTKSGVTLIDQQGKTHTASDVASLTENMLGWRLPLTGLTQWILGMPHDHSPYEANYLVSGVPVSMTQDQWQINYDDYRDTQIDQTLASLPYTTKLQQNDIRLKLVIVHW